jgi:hypothetical protein
MTYSYKPLVSGQTSKADPEGNYYHIAVSSDIPGAKSSIEFDQKCEKVNSIVEKYRLFHDFECEQRTFHRADVTQILIYRTKGNIEALQPDTQPGKEPRANKNSDKWNNIVLRHGELMNEELKIEKPDPSLSDDFKLARKRTITNSIDTINDFCKTMITLVSGFFIAYFALIKFLGAENSNYQTLLVIPPIFFILSIILLIIGGRPLIISIRDSKNIKHIENFRENIHEKKYIPMIVGMIFFLFGLILTIIASFELIKPG